MADPAANRAATTTLARPVATPEAFDTYEKRLSQNLEWALTEGSLFFEGRGAVQESLRRITRRLDELGIPYAIAGGMALYLHGYQRFTDDVDILVNREGLKRIHEKLDGLGYVRPFENSKNLRDTESRVKIEFLITGQFPGDGKPKGIAFPDPSDVAETRHGIRVINLPQLISLKLASGISGDGRVKDLGDVQELIKSLQLPASLADSLHPYSRDAYLRIWNDVHQRARRYLRLWKFDDRTANALTIDELVDSLGDDASELRVLRDLGVTLEPSRGPSHKDAYLVTTDSDVAARYGFHEESEYWNPDADDGPTGKSES